MAPHENRPGRSNDRDITPAAASTTNPRFALRSTVAALSAGLFVFAFMASPRACEGGLTAYFWLGVAVILALLVLPFVLCRHLPLSNRFLRALGFGLLGLTVWIASLVAADMQIICRLF